MILTEQIQISLIYKPAAQKNPFIWDVLTQGRNKDKTEILKNQSKHFLRASY